MKTVIFGANENCIPLLGTHNMLSSQNIEFVTPFGVDIDSPPFDLLRAFTPKTNVMISHQVPTPSTSPASTVLLIDNEYISNGIYHTIIDNYYDLNTQFILPLRLANRLNYVARNNDIILSDFDYYLDTLDDSYFDIPVPIILMVGAGERVNKFDLTLAFRELMLQDGYNISVYAHSELCELWGFHRLPAFLFENHSLKTKTRLFNHYLYEKVHTENPDIVVIDVPGGFMRINPFRFSESDELILAISSAISVSASVCSLYSHAYNDSFFSDLDQSFYYKLGFVPTLYHASNTNIKIDPENREIELFSGLIDDAVKNVHKYYTGKHSHKIFTIFDTQHINEQLRFLFQNIMEDGAI